MIDPTNIVANLPAPAQVQSTLNAWNVVALGAGAFVSHAYHLIVQAGGIKRIAINFWNSEPAALPAKYTVQATIKETEKQS